MWSRVRARAVKKGIRFTIKPKDIEPTARCPVFGTPMIYGGSRTQLNKAASLDRIVPELGYVPGNIQVISHRANTLKSNGSLRELEQVVEWLRRVSPKKTVMPNSIRELIALV